ncbi:MAG: hemerythrin domain-containing protein [Ornithinibacter sp.]
MADTRTMGIVHSALRRDLTRASDALEDSTAPGDTQRVAIAQHVQVMMDFLDVHHRGEDDWLWPTMRGLNPSASELLDQMEDDHLAIVPHMKQVTAAAAAYERSAAGREALVNALRDLRGSLDPHLRREEDDMMPIVATTLTARQWDDWEQEYYLKHKSKSELGMEGTG